MRHLKSPTALALFAVGVATLCVALALPWAFVEGSPVGFGWLGTPAVLPSFILAAAGAFAVLGAPGRRWVTAAVTLIGALAAYVSVSGARSVPTMGAVWADAEASAGPAFLVVLIAQALIVVSAWVAARSAARQARLAYGK